MEEQLRGRVQHPGLRCPRLPFTRREGSRLYVVATGSNAPLPGESSSCANGVGPGSTGSVGHVDVLAFTETKPNGEVWWTTADGGGGALAGSDREPDHAKSGVRRQNRSNSRVTDGWQEEQLDGSIDLDRLPREP